MQMTLKILVGFFLALSAANAVAGNTYVYKDKNGQVLTPSFRTSGDNFDKATKKIAPITPNDTYVSGYGPSNSSNSTSTAFAVPNGYRLPTKADNIEDWKRFDAPNHLKADFNGDGIEDEAYILPKKGSNAGYGVFASINKSKAALQRGRKFQMFKLTDSDDMSPQSFAIELAEPSNEIWKTACGKGYWECAIGEPSAFKINNPSIMFCYIESSCTMYMWDSSKSSFKEIQFSD